MPSACSTSKNIESVVTAEALTEEATKEENTEDIKEEEEEDMVVAEEGHPPTLIVDK